MRMDFHTTTFPGNKKAVTLQHLQAQADDGTENAVVNLYPQKRYQQWEGFGGAFTESAGYIFSLLTKAQQEQLIDAYYGTDGLGYTLGRIHIDSCDFSLAHFQAINDPADREMKSFSLDAAEKYQLPLLRATQERIGRKIPLMAAPWSPPDFMKTNKERNHGGKLLAQCYDFWADYLCKYLLALDEKGFEVRCMTVQNEPKAVQTWDSCIYTAHEEKEFLRDFLYPALQKHGLTNIALYLWDHNKERVFDRVHDSLDETVAHLVAGVAFHWYSGDHFEALQMLREDFPHLRFAQTEACIEYRTFDKNDYLKNAQRYAHDLIGDCNAGMSAFYDWNLLLDQEGGPNHVGNYCDAPFLFHTKTGLLEERNSYAYIGHFSRYIKPDALRIGASCYTSALAATAFQNPDGTIAAVLLNETDAALPVVLRINGQMVKTNAPAASISTAVLHTKEA